MREEERGKKKKEGEESYAHTETEKGTATVSNGDKLDGGH